MGQKRHHFVLVHGGGHGAWCWVKVVAVLEKRGHRVTAIDLLSAGENDALSADDIVSEEVYNQPLKDLFLSLPDDQKVNLVGHSLGGKSISRMSEQFPQKISVAIYIAAFMPGIDDKIMNNPENRATLPLEYHRKVEGGPVTSFGITPAVLREYFCNKCSPEDFAFALDRVKRIPSFFVAPGTKTIHLTRKNYGSVPRIYVLALDDKVILPATARKFVEVNPPNEFCEIEGDHSVFFTSLQSVGKILNDAAVKYD